jgi:hypothetical protein
MCQKKKKKKQEQEVEEKRILTGMLKGLRRERKYSRCTLLQDRSPRAAVTVIGTDEPACMS